MSSEKVIADQLHDNDEWKTDYHAIGGNMKELDEFETLALEARISKVRTELVTLGLGGEAERSEVMSDMQPNESRMAHPIDRITAATNMIEDLSTKIGELEMRLNVILLPEAPISTKDDSVSPVQEQRSLVVERAIELTRRIAACLVQVDKLLARLDL